MNIGYVLPVTELRKRLPCAKVLRYHGVVSDGERFLCPFHADAEHPNLTCLHPTDQHPYHGFYCNACAASGDVIDLIRSLYHIGYAQALTLGAEILRADDGESYEVRPRNAFDVGRWMPVLEDANDRARANPELLAYAARFEPNASLGTWIAEQWGWGLTEGANVLIPHYGPDPDGPLTAVKERDRYRVLATHGTLPFLYGAWRDRPPYPPTRRLKAILCEGETDTVYASWLFPAARVYGLPSGASAFRQEWVRFLSGCNVITAFDADFAGDVASIRWNLALCSRSARLPAGTDLRSHDADSARSYIVRAR